MLLLALALASAADLTAKLPPAPLQLWDIAWTRSLVPARLLEWKPLESAGPAVDPVSGIVVVGTRDGWLRALDPSGRTLWDVRAAGPFSAPARIDGDTVYAGNDDGHLYALELTTGKERWRYDAQEEVGTTPVVAGGMVYVSTLEDTLFAVDAKSGAWQWHHRRETSTTFTIRGAAAAMVAGGTAYAAYSDGAVAALDARTGAVRWERKVAPSGDIVDIDSIQLEGARLYAAAYSGAVMALDAATGRTEWETKIPGASRLRLADGTLVAVSTTSISALSPRDGSVSWSVPLSGIPSGDPVILGSLIVIPTAKALAWVDRTSGRTVKVFDPGTGVSATPGGRGGRLYVLSNAGELVALDLR